ncbi:MAG: beta-galactosidase [Planctomycetota bacterium JB042]
MQPRPALLVAAILLPFAGPLGVSALGQSPVAPRGVYCSCPPTSSQSNSVIPSVAAMPFVEGILVRVSWEDVEPQPGVYDFSLVDGQLALAGQHGVRVALAVVQGSHTPAWLPIQGAQMIQYVFAGQLRTVAVPWDPIYLAAWQNLIAALGAKYANDTTISIVHMTHATHNGFEMQLPIGAESTYVAAGYTPSVYTQSWHTVIGACAAAVPHHVLDVDVHPVFGSDVVAQNVVAYAKGALGPRFGALGAWWTEHNANDVYPGMFTELKGMFPDGYATVQVAQSVTNNPAAFGPDGLRGTLDLALASGIRYAEVWNADLLNPTLATDLTEVNDLFLCDGHYFPYGDACVGGGGVAPEIRVHGCPSPGAQFGVEVSGGPAGALSAMVFGTGIGSTPLGRGCDLAVTPLFPVVLMGSLGASGPAAGTIGWAGTLPAGLVGTITLQVLIADGGVPSGIAATEGIYVTFL